MKRSTRRTILLILAILIGVPVLIYLASAKARAEVHSLRACRELAKHGFRSIAEEPSDRFLGKVQSYTALCRGGERALVGADTPWVDWSNYWATGDASSQSSLLPLPFKHITRNGRGLDGALLDLEYQRIELLKFNLFDNNTYEDYVKGRDGVPGRAVKVWPAMRLPPSDPNFQAVGGDREQVCKGELIRHRNLTGICNDIKNPLMGSTNAVFARNVQFEETAPELGATELTKNRHGDRLGLLRPDPQVISRELLTRQQSQPASCNEGLGGTPDAHCDYIKAPFFNVVAAYWIQFMTHDWFSHLEEGQNGPEMIDTGCRTRREGDTERPLTPAEAAALGCRPGDRVDAALVAESGPPPTFQKGDRTYLARAQRTTRNTNTAWWDASQLYGYSERSARRVKRDPEDRAKLLMVTLGNRDGEGEGQGYLPTFSEGDKDNIHPAWTGQEAVAFPDNWSIGLSFLHNVFAREHNLFVQEFQDLAKADPEGDSGLRNPAEPGRVIRNREVSPEELYQAARLVVGAEIAKIHTTEWTTQLLYDEVLYRAMNANWHGLVKKDSDLSPILQQIVVDRLGKSISEPDQTAWYSVFASGAGIFGLGSHRYADRAGFLGFEEGAKDIWNLENPDHVNGGANHFGSPFNFPEEFVTVYRLHPLVPDLVDFRDWHSPNQVSREIPVVSTFRGAATPAMHDGGLANWGLAMGRQQLGALTLQNHPQFLQNLPMPRLASETGKLDVPALDLIRDREHGVPRFNEFRRQYGLKTLTSFDDFVNRQLAADSPERKRQEGYVKKLREIYGTHRCDDSKPITAVQNLNGKPVTDCLGHPNGTVVDNVEDLDTVVGWLAEGTRPHGFAISETQFTVFIINASRRLFSDRFLTSSFRPEFYTRLGVEWVTNNGPDGIVMEKGESNGHADPVSPMKRVLQRTIPELEGELAGVVNAFDPWARDRGEYYSLAWKARQGAESDPAFGEK